MTEEERYLEIFQSTKLTQNEIEDNLKHTNIKTTFDQLLQKGFIRATGDYYKSDEQFYAPNKPSWITANYPASRLEAYGFGVNYKMPLRLESVFYKYLKDTLKWSDNDILLFWNSRPGRHFADGIQGSYWEFKTPGSFLKYINSNSDELKRAIIDLRSDKKFNAEEYYKGTKKQTAISLISQAFRGELIIKDPGTLAYLAKHKTEFIEYVLKNPTYLR